MLVRMLLWISLLLSLAGLPGGALAQAMDDPSLTVETVATGLATPTSMAFLAPDDILVLEKGGAVRRVTGGVLAPVPVLSLSVNADSERGALGIAVDTASPPHVFIYFTEATEPGGDPVANRVYRYDWNPVSGTLTHRSLVLDLPVLPGPNHDGGIIALGPPGQAPGIGDGSLLYAVIGDLNRGGQLQNNAFGAPPDDTGVILRVRLDGSPAPGNPFRPYCSEATATICDDDGDCPAGQTCRTQVAGYYAYGVRNSFGLALDPVTGALWDTENGPNNYDEVNLVTPGMNGGWFPLQGPDARSPNGVGNLFHMPGAGVTYSDPEFSWLSTIAPTAIVFPHGSSLGVAYDDVAIVGEINYQQLYALPLNGARTGIDVAGIPGLADLVADDFAERDALRIGTGFATTDLEVGPDGHLYVVSIYAGAIYRVVPEPAASAGLAAGLALLGALHARRQRRSMPGLRAR
jgi:glucose/arabinose dehydrogenase